MVMIPSAHTSSNSVFTKHCITKACRQEASRLPEERDGNYSRAVTTAPLQEEAMLTSN
jgi:hypothetical protein